MHTPPPALAARGFARGCVATPHHLASAAGAAILEEGGNAVDAAVAANLVLGVIAPNFCGAGGDLFAIVHDGTAHGLMSAGRSPAAATPAVVREVAGVAEMPQVGPHTVTVPGAVAGWCALLEKFGTRSFGHVSTAARRFAEGGFVLSRHGVASFGAAAERFEPAHGWHRAYGHWHAGDRPVQVGYARALREIADDGPSALGHGHLGRAIVDTLRRHGGVLSRSDLHGHQATWVTPMSVPFAGHRVLELPPPTQGVTALTALGILDRLTTDDVATAAQLDRAHLQIEAVKRALADRGEHVTDPAAMRVDAGDLIDPRRLQAMADQIDPRRASAYPSVRPQPGGTAYLCAADNDGLLVSLIQSNFMGFGSGVVVDGYGIPLQNRGASFSLDEDDVNVLAPSKQPLHTLIPALVTRSGKPAMVLGSMGGDGQAQTHVQVLDAVLGGRRDLQAAITAPRWVVSPEDGSVAIESRVDTGLVQGLRDRGHVVHLMEPWSHAAGHAHGIQVLSDGYLGASDPRCEGAVTGR